MLIAFCTSLCELISTKAKPFERLVPGSLINATETTVPACMNSSRRPCSVVSYERFPTYNFASIPHSFTVSVLKKKPVNPNIGLTVV
jgi:hypothetical protein